MSKTTIQWLIRNNKMQVKGPFTTAMIMKFIAEGVFTGEEMISRHPGGQWMTIANEPEFFDQIISTLETEAKKYEQNVDEKIDALTIIKPLEIPNVLIQNKLSDGTGLKTENHTEEPGEAVIKITQLSQPVHIPAQLESISQGMNPRDHRKNIEAPQIQHHAEINSSSMVIGGSNKEKSISSVFLGLLLFVLAAGIFYFLDEEFEGEKIIKGKIRLTSLTNQQKQLSNDEFKKLLQESILEIEKDIPESYLKAEKNLIQLAQAQPSNLEIKGMLCLTYKELWPYTYQDDQDMRAINIATQISKSANSISPYAALCEVSRLMILSKTKEAKGVIEQTMQLNQQNSLIAVFYLYKAQILDDLGDIKQALAFYDKAEELWGTWNRTLSARAESLYENKSPKESFVWLNKILLKNKKHYSALALSGFITYEEYKNSSTAVQYLQSVVQTEDLVEFKLKGRAYAFLAKISFDAKETENAKKYAQLALQFNPGLVTVRKLLADMGVVINDQNIVRSESLKIADQFFRQGNYLAAQAEYKAVFEADEKDSDAAVGAAKALWLLNQNYESIEWIKKAIKANPQSLAAYVVYADYLSQRYDFANAVQILTTAAKLKPDSAEVVRTFALVELRRNNLKSAMTYAQKVIQAKPDDVESYVIFAESAVKTASTIMPINKTESDRKEAIMRDAMRAATKALEFDSTHIEAQITYAHVLAKSNGFDLGVNYLKQLINQFSYLNEYRLALAEMFVSEQRYEQAKILYEQIVDAEPRNKKAWLGLSDSLRALGQNDKAYKATVSAALIDPGDAEATFQLGKLAMDTGKLDEAIKQFKKVNEINPNYPKSYFFLGRSAYLAGDMQLAIQAGEIEKKRNPNMADPYILIGDALLAQKKFPECATAFSLAAKLRSQETATYVKAAQCYRQSGNLDVADNMLELASGKESGFADIYKEQGAIFELRGDLRAAVVAYKKYLALAPNAPDKLEIEERTKKLSGL